MDVGLKEIVIVEEVFKWGVGVERGWMVIFG